MPKGERKRKDGGDIKRREDRFSMLYNKLSCKISSRGEDLKPHTEIKRKKVKENK